MLNTTNFVKNTEQREIKMGFALLKKKAHALLDHAGWIAHIKNNDQYETALSLMEELIENYDENLPLIEILSVSIARFEDEDKSFQKFNRSIQKMNSDVSVLKVLMDQYQLGVDDFPDIGSKSLVSKIINHQRRLTVDHISALCKRFKISPSLFFG